MCWGGGGGGGWLWLKDLARVRIFFPTDKQARYFFPIKKTVHDILTFEGGKRGGGGGRWLKD